MHRVDIKAISVNNAYRGRKFKTAENKAYFLNLFHLLPKNVDIPNKKNIKLRIVFGYSNVLTDIDNGLKPFIDVLQSKYEFNDRYIFELSVKKEITPRTKEFVTFEFY